MELHRYCKGNEWCDSKAL
ncbi:hypothetical protein LINPERHAP2_LOCUS15870 [Linum perenne]